MEAFLIDDWLRETEPVPTLDQASVSVARDLVRKVGAEVGLPPDATAAMAVVVSELAQNQLAHGVRGAIGVRPITRGETRGLEIVAGDTGRGIQDPDRAFAGIARAVGSLGVGLAGVRAMSDEVDVDVRLEEGTCIWARKFAASVPKRREVGILTRPCEGERASGDQAGFVRSEGRLVLAVADGLGHGPEARAAADLALIGVRKAPARASVEILRACDPDLQRSRGAVMSLLALDEASGAADFAGVGNVATRAVRWRHTRSFPGSSYVLGTRGSAPKRFAAETFSVDRDEVLLMCSDGISSRLVLDDRADLLHAAPIVVAQRILEAFGQTNDDATVLVAR